MSAFDLSVKLPKQLPLAYATRILLHYALVQHRRHGTGLSRNAAGSCLPRIYASCPPSPLSELILVSRMMQPTVRKWYACMTVGLALVIATIIYAGWSSDINNFDLIYYSGYYELLGYVMPTVMLLSGVALMYVALGIAKALSDD